MKIIYLFVLFALDCSCENVKNTLSITNPIGWLSKQAYLQRRQLKSVKNHESPGKHDNYFKNIQNLYLKLSEFDRNDTAPGFIDPCILSIKHVAQDLLSKELYAVSMIDAWGKPPSGLLEGSLTWPGAYHECTNADATSFTGRYCLIKTGESMEMTIFVPSFPPELTIGGCFPSTCSQSAISSLLRQVYKNITVDCPVQYTAWNPRDIVALIVCILLCIAVVSSSIYDCLTAPKQHHYSILVENCHSNSIQPQPAGQEGKLHKVLTAFSLFRNVPHILNTKQNPTDLHCLHGLRFLSITWVMLGHSALILMCYSDNVVTFFDYLLDHWEFQGVMNGTFCVDTFFFISALLFTLLTLRQLAANNGKMNVFTMYLHRYLRLTPVYAFVILMLVSLWLKIGDGPLWPAMGDTQIDLCGKYWFANLLYFTNLYPANLGLECYAIGWYLANDFQFYILAPIFIYILYRYPKIGLSLVSFMTVASIAVTGVFTVHTKQQPLGGSIGLIAWSVKSFLSANLSFSSSPIPDIPQYFGTDYSWYMSDVYAKPWCRISSYLIGMMIGYFLYLNNSKMKIPKGVVAIGWVVAVTISCCVIYCLYPSFSTGHHLDFNVAALYNALSRPAWCVSLAWLTIACLNGYGGPVNTFLSWKVFLPLSRLTYCMYLSHPLVIYWLVLGGEGLLHFSVQTLILVFLSTLFLTTLVSFVMATCIEFPFVILAKVALNRRRSTPPAPPVSEAAAYPRAQSAEEVKDE